MARNEDTPWAKIKTHADILDSDGSSKRKLPSKVRKNTTIAHKLFFVPLTVANTASLRTNRYSHLEYLPAEMMNMMLNYLPDPNDRIMLALTTKPLARYFNYLTATGYISSLADFRMLPFLISVNRWLFPRKNYYWLCGKIKAVDSKLWTDLVWYLHENNKQLPSRHSIESGVSRFGATNLSR